MEGMVEWIWVQLIWFQYVTRLGAWAHYGMGYSMGVMFQLKYVVTYGLSCTVARAEQIRTPNHPKCIGRIHLYSDMWRYFDQGLYFFLRKYVISHLVLSATQKSHYHILLKPWRNSLILLTLIPYSRVLREKLVFTQLVINWLLFMEPKGSLLCFWYFCF